MMVPAVSHFEFAMHNLLLSAALCVAFLLVPPRAAFSAEDDLSGFTLKQLDTAIRASGVATQTIYSILTFDSEERSGDNLAVLSGSRSGWHITVLHRVVGGLKVEWRSGKLTDDFDVSSSKDIEIDGVGDEQVVRFSGCAAHQCGGADGLLGVLIYSPLTKQAFFAHYRYDENKPVGSLGTVMFSKNASQPGYERYKAALQNAMNELLRR